MELQFSEFSQARSLQHEPTAIRIAECDSSQEAPAVCRSSPRRSGMGSFEVALSCI